MEQNRRRQVNRGRTQRPNRRRPDNKGLGISTFVYFLIFFYLVYSIITFLFKDDINYISADKGNIYAAEVFDGIILRNETVVNSESSGIASFYVPEGEKINIDSLVCMIDSNGDFTNEIKKNITYIDDKLAYSNNSNSDGAIRKTLYTYAMNYSNEAFGSVYTLKTNLQETLSNITQSLYINDQVDMDSLRNKEVLESQISSNINFINAFKSGVVSYKIDGYESFDIQALDVEALFKHESEEIYTYKEENVKKDKPLFKIIDNDKWYIISKMNETLMDYIENKEYISINILEKDITANGKIVDIIEQKNKKYIILEIDRYFNQYLGNRDIKFQIVYQQYEGIKIPKTAIAEKEFIKIPKECITQKGNTKGVLKKTFGENFVGGESVEFIKIGFNYNDKDYYYVPIREEGLQMNDIIINETQDNYSLNEKKSLPGVYRINKGYTTFRLIEVIHATDRYMIVKPNTDYGIRIYDRVIADSSTVEEDIILY